MSHKRTCSPAAALLGAAADSRPGRRRRGQLLHHRPDHHRRPLREGQEDQHALHLLFCHPCRQVAADVLTLTFTRHLTMIQKVKTQNYN